MSRKSMDSYASEFLWRDTWTLVGYAKTSTLALSLRDDVLAGSPHGEIGFHAAVRFYSQLYCRYFIC